MLTSIGSVENVPAFVEKVKKKQVGLLSMSIISSCLVLGQVDGFWSPRVQELWPSRSYCETNRRPSVRPPGSWGLYIFRDSIIIPILFLAFDRSCWGSRKACSVWSVLYWAQVVPQCRLLLRVWNPPCTWMIVLFVVDWSTEPWVSQLTSWLCCLPSLALSDGWPTGLPLFASAMSSFVLVRNEYLNNRDKESRIVRPRQVSFFKSYFCSKLASLSLDLPWRKGTRLRAYCRTNHFHKRSLSRPAWECSKCAYGSWWTGNS